MDDNAIIEYFRNHRLSPAGIRNFLQYVPGAREYVRSAMEGHEEYGTAGAYVNCIVKGIELPQCPVCGKKVNYRSYVNGHIHCSLKCSQNDRSTIERRKATSLERYGVSNPGRVKEFKDKRTATIRRLYGVDSILKNRKFLEKQKRTMLERYGADSYQKTKAGKRISYDSSYDTILKWKEYVIPLFTREEYHGYRHGETYRWRCAICGNEFEGRIGGYGHLALSSKIPRCMKCYPHHTNESEAENELYAFVSGYASAVRHDRTVLDGIELDILIPEKRIAIEFDGLFYHNEDSGKDRHYHSGKTERCLEKGIRLIHVFEDEWLFRKDIVKDRIRNILGIHGNRIYARDCTVREMARDESNAFLDMNHLQGHGNAECGYGLYHGDELVSVMTFGKPRFSRNYDYELIRYCSKLGCNVVGGASKLLAHFERNHHGTIVSYADRRYSDGNLYIRLGFSSAGISEPNYWWCRNRMKLSRYQCQKHRLKNVLKDRFDPSRSESENMKANGWSRIYDCGNMIFIKNAKTGLKKNGNMLH